ncbi:ras-related protein Rab-37-like isoform X2 [Leuresthes tenuis]|uniref:ras-related protein Rab-37-like isoform X2 n=1 Tax=Leuresthes tenuis TaxID=355514 RepID=UPI003B50C717
MAGLFSACFLVAVTQHAGSSHVIIGGEKWKPMATNARVEPCPFCQGRGFSRWRLRLPALQHTAQNKVVDVDNLKVKLQIWDTAGQERFRSVTHAYYRDAQALLLLYDITSKPSFDNIRAWLTEIHEYAQKDVVIMLLGNKSDMTAERVVKKEDGERLAKEYGVPFMETSAKTGVNVELAFLAIAKELKHRATQQPNDPKFKIHDYIESKKHKSACCGLV